MPDSSTLEPIAIIGIGCRLPGGASNAESYWNMMMQGTDAIKEMPQDRWSSSRFYDPEPGHPGKTYSKWAGLIDAPEAFDPHFFGISEREAPFIDPQQRLLLEATWEALEDGGQQIDLQRGHDTGVFVGISTSDYPNMQLADGNRAVMDAYTATGGAMSIAANRISYVLNFQGPSMVVDTACSSSLVAVHLACKALWNKECSRAVAAGVNCLLSPQLFVAFSSMNMLSPDGRCKAFDASANGFVRGEGVGAICLKPLSAALADGDEIYAVIRSTAVNQDGRTAGMTLPSRQSQQQLVVEACRLAGVSPHDIQYVEAHGTGTAAGDPIETSALGTVLGEGRKAGDEIIIGSVKTNIGHLEAGAGIAGIIKVALCLKHRMVPPNLHFNTPNPAIDFEKFRLKVPKVATPLLQSGDGRLLACINSFGFGGTNAHAVLEAAPAAHVHDIQPSTEPRARLLPLSVRGSDAALKAVARKNLDYLLSVQDDESVSLADICAVASQRRTHHERRLAIVGSTKAEMAEALSAFLRDEMHPALSVGQSAKEPRLAFVFSGQGPQWWGMGRELMATEPVFRQVIQDCHDELLKLGGWSLIEELSRDERNSRMVETEFAQPAIFALQVALAALWQSWGITPGAVVGHSVGEVAAAYLAGALDLSSAVRVIYQRGRCMEHAPERGKMIAAALTRAEAEEAIAPYNGRVSLAAVNGPKMVSIAGDAHAVEEIFQKLEATGLYVRQVPVNYAFHSAHMDPVQTELAAALSGLQPQAARLPIYSTVTGGQTDGMHFAAGYWWNNVRQTVLFAPAIDTLIEAGYTHFIEVSPHPVLSNSIKECLALKQSSGLVQHSLKRQTPELAMMLGNLAAMHVHGHSVDWRAINPETGHRVALPPYPWQKESYWSEPVATGRTRRQAMTSPLLEWPLNSLLPTWESRLDKRLIPHLPDHRVSQHILFPAAGYVEMVLAAGLEMFGGRPLVIEELDIQRGCIIPQGDEFPVIQLCYQPEESTFLIQSTISLDPPTWTPHVTGRLRTEATRTVPPAFDIPAIQSRCPVKYDTAAFYEATAKIELHYGPQYQGVQEAWGGSPTEALARIQMPERVCADMPRYQVHPALLDCCFQLPILLNFSGLPARIERLRCHVRPGSAVWAYTRNTRQIAGKLAVRDIYMLDEHGNVLMEIIGYTLKYTTAATLPGEGAQGDWLYAPQWVREPLLQAQSRASSATLPSPARHAARLRQEAVAFREVLELDKHQRWLPRLDQLGVAFVQAALQKLGWRPAKGQAVTTAGLMKKLEIHPRHERRLRRLLMLLAQHGVLKANAKPAGESWRVVSLPTKVAAATAWQEMVFDFPSLHPELILMERCAEGLAELLRDECEPEQLLRPGGSWNMLEHVHASSAFTRVSNHVVAQAVAAAVSSLPEGRRVRILEIGAGTGGVSKGVLAMLPKHDVDYCFTDTTDQSFTLAGQKLSDYPFVRYQTLDLDLPVEPQGFAGEQFDIIIATNALALSTDLPRALAHTRQLLASGGWLIAVECERPAVWHDLVSGMDERWWRFNDARTNAGHPLLNRNQWQDVLAEAGFADFQAITDTSTKKTSASQMVLLSRGPAVSTASEAAAAPEVSGNDTWLIFADRQGLGKALAESLQAQGQECLLVQAGKSYAYSASGVTTIRPTSPEDYVALIATALSKGRVRGIVHLWSLDTPAGWELTTAELAAAQTLVCHSPLLLVQALVTASASVQVYFVTRGARPVGKEMEGLNLAQSPLHGLVRVIMNEHAELQPKAIDLDHASATSLANDAWLLTEELLHSDREDEIAWRGEARHVIRLVRDTIDALHQQPAAKPAARICHRLESARPGALDQLVFRAKERRKPGPGEVEIEICAAALNFRDVMKALGIYPAEADDAMQLGDECAGHVVAVGKGVKNFKVGDAVMALAAGCFATHVTTPAFMVMSKPTHLTMEEAATMMVTYLTASYALTQQGHMEKGERVLIHAGTGGVGQAAIRIAQEAGAEIFTTAGSAEKRRFLHQIGVPHVLDSRTVTFGEEIMKITNGEGIDMVLNSLAGEAIHQSLAVLRQYGRFLEIGKRDIYGNTKVGLFPFRKNLSYHAIDLGHALNPRNSTQVMGNLRQLFSKQKLPALPYRSFPLAAASDAFRYITQARQIGKVVLNVSESPVPLTSDVPPTGPRFKANASYLVVGGLGGYGLVLCQWLVDNGARHLVLTGRRGLVDEEAIEAVAVMRAAGATVSVLKSDASRPEHVRAMLKKIQLRCPPLRGIFHVAMVLDDGLITQLDAERFKRVTTPKMDGAWNLHQQTLRMKLDHFVLFSSVSALVGSPGQANYAAANAFLDALAQHRRSQGLPALSINWGVLSEVGVVARNKKLEERFERIGWSGLSPSETLPILGRLLCQTAIPQMMVARIDWNRWAANTPRLASIPRFAQLTTEEALKTRREAQDADWLRNSVLAASGNDQFLLVESFLRDQIARVLRTTPSKLDAKRPINEIGMDSLMAVELIHQIEVKAGVVIPTSQLMSGAPTIHKLTELMLHNLTGGKMEAASTATEVTAGSADISNDSFVKDADLTHWGIRFADAIAPVKAPKHILLTGAQEFLGAYLLRELLQQTQAKIHCFSSAADSASAMQEIVDHLSSHACWKSAYRARIIPVLGDLSKPLLGLTPADFDRLASTVDVIYHAAAHINHIAAYDQLKAVNVNGSVEIIRLAAQDRLKPVHYLSSASVLAASSTENNEPLQEDDPLPEHANLMVGYSQSRWVSEQLFLQAREHGLPVNVYRPGLLVGDDQTGICPPDNIIWLFLKTCIETGSGPIAGYNSILTPVDFVAAAIMRLSQNIADGGHNYHLINSSAPNFGELLELVRADGYPLRMMAEDQWEAELTGGSLGIQISPIAAYQLFIPRQTLSSLVQEQSSVFCRNTLQGLQGTGVSCPPIDQTRMHLYLQYFIRTGFLQPPGDPAKT